MLFIPRIPIFCLTSSGTTSFEKLVVPELVNQKIGVLGMKSMANGILLKSKTATPIECLHYALNLPTSVVITGIDSMEILDQAVAAARTFQPLNQKELDEYDRWYLICGLTDIGKSLTLYESREQAAG